MANQFLLKNFLALNPSREMKDAIQGALLESFDNVRLDVRKKALKRESGKKEMEVKESDKRIGEKEGKGDIRHMRKQYLENFDEKVVENKLFAVKFIKEHKLKEKKKKEQEELEKKKLAEEMHTKEKEKEVVLLQKEVFRKKKLEELKLKSERRKEDINYYKRFAIDNQRVSISADPLYKKLEEDYKINYEIPELERRKHELQQKREIFKPVSLSEIREHAKKIDVMLCDFKEKKSKHRSLDYRVNNVFAFKSKFLENLIEEEKKQKERELRRQQEAKIRAEKKKKYAEIVGEMFIPAIDKFKQQEMKLIKAKLQFPVKLKTPGHNTSAEEASDYSRSISVQPKRWKKNTMIPEKPEKREGKPVFYLEERRKFRDQIEKVDKKLYDWEESLKDCKNDKEKYELMKKNAEKLEKEAKRFELKLAGNELNLDVAEHVNNLIVNSIKAKLSYLQ